MPPPPPLNEALLFYFIQYTTNKIKLEVSGSVNRCYMVHTDMASGDSVAIYTWSSMCFMLHLESHVWVTVQINVVAFI